MEKFVTFWQKDLINKLIVLVVLGMITAIVGLTILLVAMPGDKSVWGAVYEYFPAIDPTRKANDMLTKEAATLMAIPTATSTPMPPTITSLPTLQILPTATMTVTGLIPSPALALVSTNTPLPVPTSTMISVTMTATSPKPLGRTCIPANTPQTAYVMEIIDGNTIRALIDGLVYTVRYIGITLPKNVNFAELARYENYVLVYGREVQLIPGDTDKDARGRLLRYVMVKETFVNLDLLQRGLGTVPDVESDFTCLADFRTAEGQARDAKAGLWSLPQSTSTP